MTGFLEANPTYQTGGMRDTWAQQLKEEREARGEIHHDHNHAEILKANKEKYENRPQSLSDMKGDDWLKLILAKTSNRLPDEDNTKDTMIEDARGVAMITGMTDVRNKMGEMKDIMEKGISMDANQYVGQKVEVQFNKFRHTEGQLDELGYDLPYNAHSVNINIFDEEARQVRTLELKHGDTIKINGVEQRIDLKAGRKSFQWNGSDDFGKQVKEGQFKFQIRAFDKKGHPLKTPSTGELIKIKHFTSGILESNTFDGKVRTATVNGIEVPADNIKSFSVDRHKKGEPTKTPEQLGAEMKATMERDAFSGMENTAGIGLATA